MKNIYCILIFILLSSSNVFAQPGGKSESMEAFALVYLVVPLSITATTGDLDFGEIIHTNSPTRETLSPTNGKLFIVSGHPYRDITFTFISADMDNSVWVASFGGNVDNLQFVPDIELDDGTKVFNGDSHTLLLSGGIGELDVWVGGYIDIAADQEHGDYTGLFTLSVTY